MRDLRRPKLAPLFAGAKVCLDKEPSHYDIAPEFSEIFLASVNPPDAQGPYSANWHGALTQFHGRGAEDGRVGADCRGSGSRPRALSRSLAVREPDGAPFLYISLPLSRACTSSSIFSSFLLRRHLALRTYILTDMRRTSLPICLHRGLRKRAL